MKTSRLVIAAALAVLIVLGFTLVFAITRDYKNFCIKIDEGYSSEGCGMGCCTDSRGFVHNKYPENLCEEQGGEFQEGLCGNVPLCG